MLPFTTQPPHSQLLSIAGHTPRQKFFGNPQVHQLEREVGDLRSELASRGHGQSELWQERSELIDDKARLGRQIAELSKRTQHSEADLAMSRATARALASNNEDLQQRLAKQTSTCQKLEQRCAVLLGASSSMHEKPIMWANLSALEEYASNLLYEFCIQLRPQVVVCFCHIWLSYKVADFAGRMSWVGSWLTPGVSWALRWMSYETC